MKAQTFKDVATTNLKVEALLMKAMRLLGVNSLEITQEDLQNRSKDILRLTVGPGECKANLQASSILGFNVVVNESIPSDTILMMPEDMFPELTPEYIMHLQFDGHTEVRDGRFTQEFKLDVPIGLQVGPKGCHRSHPHENMSPECEAKTEKARISAVDQVRKASGLDHSVQLDEIFDRR